MELINIPHLTVEEFFAIPNGTYVYNNGADQCVALANQYHQGSLNGSFVPVDSAFQWWDDFDSLPQLYNVYNKLNDNPQKGDIFVARYGKYDAPNGHIGVVNNDWDGSYFGTMEQNAGSGLARWTYRYNRDNANILGFLRPKTSPQPAPMSKEKQMYIIQDTGGTAWLVQEDSIQGISDPARRDLLARMIKSNPDSPDMFSPGQVDILREYCQPQQVKVDTSGLTVNVDAIVQAIVDKIGGGSVSGVTSKADILSSIEANYPEDK